MPVVPNLLSAQAIPLSEHVGSCIEKEALIDFVPCQQLWDSAAALKADVTSTSEGTCSIIQILLRKHRETVYIIAI